MPYKRLEALEKMLELKGNQVMDQQRAVVCGLRANLSDQIIGLNMAKG